MSEHNEEESLNELSFGVIGTDNSIFQIEFKDGVRTIEAWVVTECGGRDELAKIAHGLKAVTYGDFMNSIHEVMTSRKVNNYVNNFVAQHFAPKLF